MGDPFVNLQFCLTERIKNGEMALVLKRIESLEELRNYILHWLRMKKTNVFGLVLLIIFVLVLLSGGCQLIEDDQTNDTSDSTDTPDNADTCTVLEKNRFVYDIMQGVYLWVDQMPVVDHTEYASPANLLEALRYKDLDKWSYITPKVEYDQYFNEGQTIGIGIGYRYDGTDLWIAYVLNNSPAALAGLSRGDRILEINGKTLQEIVDQEIENANMGPAEENVVVNLVVQDTSGETENISLTKSVIMIDTVLQSTVIEQAGQKIGYLVFMQFLETSTAELDSAFDTFKAEGVDELILDLRYNGGGRISVANHLAKLIAGDRVASTDIFTRYIHNDKLSSQNWNSEFGPQPDNALGLDRLVVITTGNTASASELVINSLKPYQNEIVLIGDTTHGKPVGMYSFDFCDMVVVPISFQLQNANWEGEYYSGLPATCSANDELTRALGNQEEDSLQEALFFLENATCSPTSMTQTGSKMTKRAVQRFPESGMRKMMGMM